MMRLLRHPHPDQMLVEATVELGCLAPTYTRAQHPGMFSAWEDRANEVGRQAGLLPAGCSSDRLEDARADCDSFSGHPLPLATPFTDGVRRDPLLHAAVMAIAALALAVVALVELSRSPTHLSPSLNEARLFIAPKIALRARAAELAR